jgi:plasmid stabilization system protein ParE
MKRRIVLRRTAEREYDNSIAWYESERVGLGQEFRQIIEEQLQLIAEDPNRFPIVKGEVRRAVVLRRFPFVIHFLAEKHRIVILSVFHTSRQPEQVKNRR